MWRCEVMDSLCVLKLVTGRSGGLSWRVEDRAVWRFVSAGLEAGRSGGLLWRSLFLSGGSRAVSPAI
ncbi:hypothetical protein KSP40_PGU001863 [Platanthera guangdongensis]|uniref:Uncharacterized protein n=1 Tax=Platanthera guangdongensis TaxID=2320717 RepID=A0ABR2LNL5_9ASPA